MHYLLVHTNQDIKRRIRFFRDVDHVRIVGINTSVTEYSAHKTLDIATLLKSEVNEQEKLNYEIL